MRWVRRLTSRGLVVGEIFQWVWRQRLWWMVPLVVVLLLFGALMFLASSTPIAPFVYTLF